MSEENLDNLTAKVTELEGKLDATLEVVGRLVKALDYMRTSAARFIFEMDLVKHALCEAGYADTSEASISQSP